MKFAREAWPFVLPFLAAARRVLAGRNSPGCGFDDCARPAGASLLPRSEAELRRPPDVVLAPAEGTVTAVEVITDSALGDETWRRISIFLSVFNVHTQKTPVEGVVIGSIATPGKKLPAYRKEAGDVNENHLTLLRRTHGDLIAVRQIAGLVARRVVSRLQAGQRVNQGEPLGLIKFGSRVDVFVPMSYDPLVEKGQRVISGETRSPCRPIPPHRRPATFPSGDRPPAPRVPDDLETSQKGGQTPACRGLPHSQPVHDGEHAARLLRPAGRVGGTVPGRGPDDLRGRRSRHPGRTDRPPDRYHEPLRPGVRLTRRPGLLRPRARPALLSLGPGRTRPVGFAAPAVYLLCSAARLARFNVSRRTSDPAYFVGLPAPAAAGAIGSILFFVDTRGDSFVLQLAVLGALSWWACSRFPRSATSASRNSTSGNAGASAWWW